MALETELAFFNTNRGELVERHAGKFALIKGSELIDVFDSAETAFNAGVAHFGREPFLTKQILREDPVAQAPAIFTGLVGTGA
jgi:hypothetical protein